MSQLANLIADTRSRFASLCRSAFHHGLVNPLLAYAERHKPDFVIGGQEAPYLRRWWLIPRNPLLNVYLHQILRSDDDRALHCHPWLNLSIILRGYYVEIMPIRQSQATGFDFVQGFTKGRFRLPRDIIFRRAKHRHRLSLDRGIHCWSLFITGPRIRTWGFHCRSRFVPWQEFTAPNNPGEIGQGCGE